MRKIPAKLYNALAQGLGHAYRLHEMGLTTDTYTEGVNEATSAVMHVLADYDHRFDTRKFDATMAEQIHEERNGRR